MTDRSPVLIHGVVQHYDWGDLDAIPRLLGLEPDGRPWAELWFGDHPGGPATIPSRDGQILDAGLPFLLKVLAAGAPLSLQAHPSKEQAEAGFAREEAAGIPRDAPNRIYRDANHKPELLCALSPFDALCGFRPPRDAAAELRTLEVAALEPLIAALGADDLAGAFAWLMTRDRDDAVAIAGAVADASDDAWTNAIAATHPDDIGVVTALLLNRVTLAPGQAIYLDAATLHAYVRGVGIEIMSASDNVVRGGLTTKHVDGDELRRILRYEPDEPRVIEPLPAGDGVVTWPVPTDEFRLLRIDPGGRRAVELDRAAIVLCSEGTVTVDGVTVPRGEAAFVPASAARHEVEARGIAYCGL